MEHLGGHGHHAFAGYPRLASQRKDVRYVAGSQQDGDGGKAWGGAGLHLAPLLRHPPSTHGGGPRIPPTQRGQVQGHPGFGITGDRISCLRGETLHAALERYPRAHHQVWQETHHLRARQHPQGARQAPRRHPRGRDREAEHPDVGAAGVPAGRGDDEAGEGRPRRQVGAPLRTLPWRRGADPRGHRRRCQPECQEVKGECD
mmetsp:Transcript_14574/g.29142  ORF Transcript_14574/g.29142 Transcript_14574/m.29142 type:complete len:202 (-) Transcript_14574:214-819(-)